VTGPNVERFEPDPDALDDARLDAETAAAQAEKDEGYAEMASMSVAAGREWLACNTARMAFWQLSGRSMLDIHSWMGDGVPSALFATARTVIAANPTGTFEQHIAATVAQGRAA
jgi:hypothetical protein